MRESIGEQNRAIDGMAKVTLAAQERRAAAQAQAAAKGKKYDMALAQITGASVSTCNEAMPACDEVENRYLTKLASLSVVMLLAGCASAPPAPLRVEVPIIVSYVREVPALPAYEFGALAPGAADGDIVLAMARDWPRGRAYEAKLEAVIAGCQ